MASPIFTSKASSGFSAKAILRGIQLAILGIYRSLQNPNLYTTFYYERAFVAIAISIAAFLALRLPIYLLQLFAFIFKGKYFEGFIDSSKELVKILNLGAFFVSLSQHFSTDFDDLFLASMSFMDSIPQLHNQENSGQKFHVNLVALKRDREEQHVFKELMISGYATGQGLIAVVLKYLEISISTSIFYMLLHVDKLFPFVLGFITFLSLNSKIGVLQSMVVFGILLSVPPYYSTLFWNTYWGSRRMILDFLHPFFSRVRFTKIEKEQWIRSREGVLLGFSLFIYISVRQFPCLCLLVYGLAESGAAYLVTKVSDPPPRQVSQLVQWNTTQVVWDKEKEKCTIEGKFVDDVGFRPIPGSYILR